MKKALLVVLIISLSLNLIGAISLGVFYLSKSARAEQSGGSPESGVTSYIKTVYDDLVTLGFGSDVDIPDWGAYWNRIKTAAKWVPSGAAGVANVLSGQTFYGNSRTQQTGTMPDKEGDNASTARSAAAGVNYLTAPEGYYDGNDRVSATDAQIAALAAYLLTGNIKSGVTIFGIGGTLSSYGIPKTGQTTSYPNGDETDRDDGHYQKGTPVSGDRFTDTADTTNSVTDNGTGLIWVKNETAIPIVGGYRFMDAMVWNDALPAVAALNAANGGAGYDGSNQWRLPNIKELQSIVDYERVNPSINTSFFTSKPDNYWSSTTCADRTLYAWVIYFYSGLIDGGAKEAGLYYVRPVRGGQ